MVGVREVFTQKELTAVKQSRDFALKHIHWLDQMLGAPGAANDVITNLRLLAEKLEQMIGAD